ncbi:MAG: hypothetical protein GY818_04050, partial [Planctomycetaceae bacterium]|nr:hypothetical protein [Planctomycetaceae bacterium]
ARYQSYQKTAFDQKRVPAVHYDCFEEVWIDETDTQVGTAAKVNANRRKGVIVDKIGENSYLVKLTKSGRYTPVNVGRMYKVLEYDSEDFADPLTLSAKRHIELSKYTNSAARGVMNRSKQRKKRRTNKPQKQLRKKRTHPSKRKAGTKLIPYLPKKKRKLAVLNVEPIPSSNPRKRTRRSHSTSSSKRHGSKL